MKRLFAILLVCLAGNWALMADNAYKVDYQYNNETYTLNFEIGDVSVEHQVFDGQTFSVIAFEGNVHTKKAGFAELPFVHAALMLEADNNVELSIGGGDYEDIQLEHPLLPSRGVIYRNQDPSAIPYVIDPKSITDEWYPGDLAENTGPYIMRDVRGTNVYVYPFQYNAHKNVLRVYRTMEVSLENNNTTPVNPISSGMSTIEYEMDAVYASVFINYDQYRDDLTIGEAGDILVITTARDEAAMDPYIQWKMEKGYNVTKEVVATGTNVNSMVQDAWNNNNDLLYVQLVGDWADIKCNTLSSGSPMDPQVGAVAGSDEVPDICVGRFSAENPTHVTTQVDKVITYEKTPQMLADWYKTATGIGSIEGPGDDGEDDFEHLDVIFNDKLDPFTYDTYNDIYEPSGSISDVNAAINGGTSVLNYCGHGSPTSWGTTGFSNSNVAGLSNGDMTPWIVSVACNNGDFHTGTCFAEAWQRHDGGGSVMFLGGSISQPWDPPMRGQDYFADLLTGGYDYTAHAGQSGINTTEGRTTLGAIIFNGLVLMTTESGTSSDWETAKTWNLFGDPSMQARSDVPADLSLSSNLVMVGIPFATTITTTGGPVEGAMVTLSQNDNYYTGITDASGSVSIDHMLEPGDALLVVTGFNTETIYETITVVPADGAYVIYASHDVNDAAGNGDGMLDYGETALLSLTMANVGSSDATNVEVILSTEDEYVNILDGTASYGTIAAGTSLEVTDGFEIEVAADIPDGHTIIFDVETTGEDTWNSNFSETGHAPVLMLGNYSVSDPAGNGNGKIDPGETVELSIFVNNEGSSDATDVEAVLSSGSEYIEINAATMAYGDISAGGDAEQTYSVTASTDTPPGHSASFEMDISAELGIIGSGEFNLVVGQIPVLVVDLDGNNNSSSEMMACFDNLSVGAEMMTDWPEDLNLYSSVFVCLGVYPDNHVLGMTEGQTLADFMNNGGKVYMEGGDTWFYDQATPAHSMFNINGLEDGSDDLGTQLGQSGSFTEGLLYDYEGDNSWIDRISPTGSAFSIFKNQSPAYHSAVANDEGTYKTIGSSFEFGGLTDGDMPLDYLMHLYLDFFDIDAIWVGVDEEPASVLGETTAWPNPFNGETHISFTLEEKAHLSVEVYAMCGQRITQLADRDFEAGTHQLRWNASSDALAKGVYFLKIRSGNDMQSLKLLKLQ